MTATMPQPDPKARPIQAKNETAALEALLREVGCRLPSDSDTVEELLREVSTPKERR